MGFDGDPCNRTETIICRNGLERVCYSILPFVCLTGLTLNSCTIWVFSRPRIHLRISRVTLIYLTWMTAADVASSVFVLPLGITRCVPSRDLHDDYMRKVFDLFVLIPLANISGTASVWITSGVTVHRYFTLKSHMRGTCGQACSPSVAKSFICASLTLSAFINVPFFFYMQIEEGTQCLSLSSFGKSKLHDIWSWTRLFIAKIIPIIVVFAFNFMLLRMIWLRKKLKKTGCHQDLAKIRRKSSGPQTKLTLMLLSISTIFLICHFGEPFIQAGVVSVLFPSPSHSDPNSDIYFILRACFNLLEMISFSTNFFFFVIFNDQFRICLRMACSVICANRVRPIEPNPTVLEGGRY